MEEALGADGVAVGGVGEGGEEAAAADERHLDGHEVGGVALDLGGPLAEGGGEAGEDGGGQKGEDAVEEDGGVTSTRSSTSTSTSSLSSLSEGEEHGGQ